MKPHAFVQILGTLLLFGTVCHGQNRPDWIQDRFENLDFAAGAVGAAPPGWHMGPANSPAYTAQIAAGAACLNGKQCGSVRSVGLGPHEMCFLYQTVDATPYRGKVLVYRAAAKVAGNGLARLLVRVHREDNGTSFFDNMGEHPIASGDWGPHVLVFPIDADARDIEFGIQLYGEGAAWIDFVSMTSPIGEGEKAIRAMFTKFTAARDTHDGHAMAELYSESGEYINAFNDIRVKGQDGLERMWSGTTGGHKRTVQSVELLTPNMAVMRVAAEFDDPSERLEETFMLVTEGGEWKIRVHQAMRP